MQNLTVSNLITFHTTNHRISDVVLLNENKNSFARRCFAHRYFQQKTETNFTGRHAISYVFHISVLCTMPLYLDLKYVNYSLFKQNSIKISFSRLKWVVMKINIWTLKIGFCQAFILEHSYAEVYISKINCDDKWITGFVKSSKL
jgi:hypothetical protein